MFTFQPSLILKIRTIFAWLEAQLRSDWISIFIKDARLRGHIMDALSASTGARLHKAQALWDACEVIPPAWANDENLLSLTGVSLPGPGLFLLHFRLSAEIEHFTALQEKQAAWQQHLDEKQTARANRMLPSWENRLRNQKASRMARSKREWKHAWVKQIHDKKLPGFVYAFTRMLVGGTLISILATLTGYVVSNQQSLIYSIAQSLVEQQVPFETAYTAFSMAMVIAVCIFTVICIEFTKLAGEKVSTEDLYDVLYEINENTQDRLAEIAERQEHPFPDDIPLPYIQIVREKHEVGNGHK